jgi:hypothetical protein
MGEIKTKVTSSSVEDFLNSIEGEAKRKDAFQLLYLFKSITKLEPKLWSNSVIGFGQYHYKSEKSKQEGDWFLTGFSPRKANITIYTMHGNEMSQDLLAKLGKHKTGMGCLYINKLSDVDMKILEELIRKSFDYMKKK